MKNTGIQDPKHSPSSDTIEVVLVDDTPFIRQILRKLISEAEGMRVTGEAENGLEALLVVREKKPHVVIMDIVMPEKNGIEATREILQEFPEIHVIACSTARHEKIISEAINAGCSDYIFKPFKREDILKSIRQSVQKREDFLEKKAL